MNCDMCGKESRLFKTNVEGSLLNLCDGCSKFGKVISAVRVEPKVKQKQKEEFVQKAEVKKTETILGIVSNYGQIIKKKREELGIKQEDLAKNISERASLLHKMEVNSLEPTITLARKIEKFLHIRLVEQREIESGEFTKLKSEGFTLGDFVKKKK